MANETIKNTAKEKGVKLWIVAEACGMTDSAFSRKLRHDLPEEQKQQIIQIIEKLSQEV